MFTLSLLCTIKKEEFERRVDKTHTHISLRRLSHLAWRKLDYPSTGSLGNST